MKKYRKLFIILVVVTLITVTNFVIPVTAEGSTNILEGKEWEYTFTNGAAGTFTSNDSSSFIADMSSVGSGEWDATISMKNISLMGNETYIFVADIKSDKNRYNNFISLCPSANVCDGGMFTNYLENFTANKTVSIRRIFTPTTSYTNASLQFGLGKNGYEGNNVLVNSANKVEVTNIQLTKLSDYSWLLNDPDYSDYTYTTVTTPDDYSHKQYSYAGVLNINFAQAENKEILGKETLAVATTAGLVGKIDNKYQVYINGELVMPPEAADGWYHIDYDQLDREYNEIWTLSETNNFSILIVKNENVTTTKQQILNDLNTNYRVPNQDSSGVVKQIIEDAATDISNAQTVAEAQVIYDELGDKIELQNYKEQKADEISAYNITGINQAQRDLITAALDDINAATSKTDIDNIVSAFMDAYNLENAKKLAKQEIDELVGDYPSDEVVALALQAEEDINNAATVDEVNSILEDAKARITERQTLEEAKETAIRKIDASVPDNASDAVKEIAKKAKKSIEEANTKEEVESILEKSLKDIKAQIEKEKKEAETKNNPLTLDSIFKYFLVLFIGTIGLVVLNNKKVLKRSK